MRLYFIIIINNLEGTEAIDAKYQVLSTFIIIRTSLYGFV